MKTMSFRAAVVLVGLAFSPASASTATVEVVHEADLIASIHYPAAGGRRPALLVLGGAEGGNDWANAVAAQLSRNGFVALAQAYFKAPGLADPLVEIPLERFTRAIDRLSRDPRVDPRRIAIVGFSKGAEAALLVASRDRRIRAVVAGSPSDVVWQGIDRKTGTVGSSWSVAGKPLPYIAFTPCADCKTLASLYAASRAATASADGARIPVERIRGPILMTASERDEIWPSAMMANAIRNRIGARRGASVLAYADGGHFTLGAIAPQDADGDAKIGGGTSNGIVEARTDSWARMLRFLRRALAGYPPATP